MTPDVNFNGVWLSNYCKVTDVGRSIMPARTPALEKVVGRHGAYFYGLEKDVGVFTIKITIIGNVVDNMGSLAMVLDTDEPRPLFFSDRSGVTWQALVDGESVVETLRHTGKVELTFIAPDPYGTGIEYAVTDDNVISGADTIDVTGQRETYPVIRATFKEDAEFFAIADENEKQVIVGTLPEIGVPKVKPVESVLIDRCTTKTGWSDVVTSNYYNEGTAQMQVVSDGVRFRVNDYGTGSQFHGGAAKRAIPGAPYQDFLMTGIFSLRTTARNQIGRVELRALDANGVTVALVRMQNTDPDSHNGIVTAELGETGYDKLTLRKLKSKRWRQMTNGIFRIERKGQYFTVYIANRDSNYKVTGYTQMRFRDRANAHQRTITQVQVALQAYGTYPPPSEMYVHGVRVYKINNPAGANEVPIIFEQDDVLEIDNNTNRVTLNGEPFMKYVHPQTEFIKLNPGLNALAYSGGGAFDLQIIYKSRWYV
jgi:predicted phage tail component-like protein